MDWQNATIACVVEQTPRIRSFFLQTAVSPQHAGQHIDVKLTAPDGYSAQRKYSIASVPGAPLLELAIERLDDGEVSTFFHDIAQVGDTIELRGPIGGHFVWRPQDDGPLLCVAGGSGIVPLMAMLRERAAHAPEVTAMLLYSARSWDDIAFREELLAMQAGDPRFAFVAAITRGQSPRADDLSRRLDGDSFAMLIGKWAELPKQIYVCGSNAFVEAATGGLRLAGIADKDVRTERYGGTG
jgi:ferredoxin-NADP reductase